MALKLITAPTDLPVTVAEFKQQIRIDHDDEDALLERLLTVATAYFDGEAGLLQRALEQQTWDLIYDQFPATDIQIPLPPLISVTAIFYYDDDGFEQEVDTDDYSVDTSSEEGWIVVGDNGWPTILETINAVRIRFVAGYARSGSPPETSVPEPIRHAILLLAAHLYQNREQAIVGDQIMNIPYGIENLVARFRVYR